MAITSVRTQLLFFLQPDRGYKSEGTAACYLAYFSNQSTCTKFIDTEMDQQSQGQFFSKEDCVCDWLRSALGDSQDSPGMYFLKEQGKYQRNVKVIVKVKW